jgi:NAD(P)H-quinone oxidoreductase subunit 4
MSIYSCLFYGEQNDELHLDAVISDVKPREIFITACLLLPIIGIGFYPKLATQTYDVKAVELAIHARQVLPVVADEQPSSLYSRIFSAPTLANSQVESSINISE